MVQPRSRPQPRDVPMETQLPFRQGGGAGKHSESRVLKADNHHPNHDHNPHLPPSSGSGKRITPTSAYSGEGRGGSQHSSQSSKGSNNIPRHSTRSRSRSQHQPQEQLGESSTDQPPSSSWRRGRSSEHKEATTNTNGDARPQLDKGSNSSSSDRRKRSPRRRPTSQSLTQEEWNEFRISLHSASGSNHSSGDGVAPAASSMGTSSAHGSTVQARLNGTTNSSLLLTSNGGSSLSDSGSSTLLPNSSHHMMAASLSAASSHNPSSSSMMVPMIVSSSQFDVDTPRRGPHEINLRSPKPHGAGASVPNSGAGVPPVPPPSHKRKTDPSLNKKDRWRADHQVPNDAKKLGDLENLRANVSNALNKARDLASVVSGDGDASTVLSHLLEGLTDEQRAWAGIERVLSDAESITTQEVLPEEIVQALHRSFSSLNSSTFFHQLQQMKGRTKNKLPLADNARAPGESYRLPRDEDDEGDDYLASDEGNEDDDGDDDRAKKALCGFQNDGTVTPNSMPPLADSSFSSLMTTETNAESYFSQTHLGASAAGGTVIPTRDQEEAAALKDFLTLVTSTIDSGARPPGATSTPSVSLEDRHKAMFEIFDWAKKRQAETTAAGAPPVAPVRLPSEATSGAAPAAPKGPPLEATATNLPVPTSRGTNRYVSHRTTNTEDDSYFDRALETVEISPLHHQTSLESVNPENAEGPQRTTEITPSNNDDSYNLEDLVPGASNGHGLKQEKATATVKKLHADWLRAVSRLKSMKSAHTEAGNTYADNTGVTPLSGNANEDDDDDEEEEEEEEVPAGPGQLMRMDSQVTESTENDSYFAMAMQSLDRPLHRPEESACQSHNAPAKRVIDRFHSMQSESTEDDSYFDEAIGTITNANSLRYGVKEVDRGRGVDRKTSARSDSTDDDSDLDAAIGSNRIAGSGRDGHEASIARAVARIKSVKSATTENDSYFVGAVNAIKEMPGQGSCDAAASGRAGFARVSSKHTTNSTSGLTFAASSAVPVQSQHSGHYTKATNDSASHKYAPSIATDNDKTFNQAMEKTANPQVTYFPSQREFNPSDELNNSMPSLASIRESDLSVTVESMQGKWASFGDLGLDESTVMTPQVAPVGPVQERESVRSPSPLPPAPKQKVKSAPPPESAKAQSPMRVAKKRIQQVSGEATPPNNSSRKKGQKKAPSKLDTKSTPRQRPPKPVKKQLPPPSSPEGFEDFFKFPLKDRELFPPAKSDKRTKNVLKEAKDVAISSSHQTENKMSSPMIIFSPRSVPQRSRYKDTSPLKSFRNRVCMLPFFGKSRRGSPTGVIDTGRREAVFYPDAADQDEEDWGGLLS